jgi:hypothetical protein
MMSTRWALRALCFTLTVAALAQGPDEPKSLSLPEVVRMSRAGFGEETIVAQIKKNNRPFDLNTDEMLELKAAGVSETVLRYLVNPAAPYTPPPPPAPPAPPAPSNSGAVPASAAPVAPPPSPAKPPADPLVLKLPPEMGLYYFADGKPLQMELKPMVTSKAASSSLMGLSKSHAIGSLAGPTAKTTLPASGIDLYAKIATPIEDVVLVDLIQAKTRRDLDFGTKPDKPAFPSKSVHPFESKDVGQGVIRITLPPLKQGEYLLLILGSGEEKKGTLGKGWEFSAQ